jgi:hypothetical protein
MLSTPSSGSVVVEMVWLLTQVVGFTGYLIHLCFHSQ